MAAGLCTRRTGGGAFDRPATGGLEEIGGKTGVCLHENTTSTAIELPGQEIGTIPPVWVGGGGEPESTLVTRRGWMDLYRTKNTVSPLEVIENPFEDKTTTNCACAAICPANDIFLVVLPSASFLT